jgi:hypothetical protein
MAKLSARRKDERRKALMVQAMDSVNNKLGEIRIAEQ